MAKKRKINKDYLDAYNKVVLVQPVKNGEIVQTYERERKGWKLTYSTTTVYHICPYDGNFRKCRDCGALDEDFDVSYCLKKLQVLSAGALCNRINDCIAAGLEVKFKEQNMKFIVYDIDENEKIAEFESMDMMFIFLKSIVEMDWIKNFQIQVV